MKEIAASGRLRRPSPRRHKRGGVQNRFGPLAARRRRGSPQDRLSGSSWPRLGTGSTASNRRRCRSKPKRCLVGCPYTRDRMPRRHGKRRLAELRPPTPHQRREKIQLDRCDLLRYWAGSSNSSSPRLRRRHEPRAGVRPPCRRYCSNRANGNYRRSAPHSPSRPGDQPNASYFLLRHRSHA